MAFLFLLGRLLLLSLHGREKGSASDYCVSDINNRVVKLPDRRQPWNLYGSCDFVPKINPLINRVSPGYFFTLFCFVLFLFCFFFFFSVLGGPPIHVRWNLDNYPHPLKRSEWRLALGSTNPTICPSQVSLHSCVAGILSVLSRR